MYQGEYDAGITKSVAPQAGRPDAQTGSVATSLAAMDVCRIFSFHPDKTDLIGYIQKGEIIRGVCVAIKNMFFPNRLAKLFYSSVLYSFGAVSQFQTSMSCDVLVAVC